MTAGKRLDRALLGVLVGVVLSALIFFGARYVAQRAVDAEMQRFYEQLR